MIVKFLLVYVVLNGTKPYAFDLALYNTKEQCYTGMNEVQELSKHSDDQYATFCMRVEIEDEK